LGPKGGAQPYLHASDQTRLAIKFHLGFATGLVDLPRLRREVGGYCVRCLISLAAALVLLLVSMACHAEAPAGIVMAITGDSDPPLSVMAEIPAGLSLRLQPDTRLTFLHYGRCKLVTVVGGTLVLEPADYTAGGTVSSEADAPCPRVFALSDAGTAGRTSGGIVARGVTLPPRWPVNPQIVFTGPRAAAVSGAMILSEDRQPLLRLDVAAGRGNPPAGATALKPDGHYTLRLTLRDQSEPVDIPFSAAGPPAAGTLIVLRVD
jgi:hypothetical protein